MMMRSSYWKRNTRNCKHLVFTFLITLAPVQFLNADTKVYNQINDLEQFAQQIESDKVNKEETLVIFDIDDTLLESANFVGSGKWYNWQRGREVFDTNGKLFTINEEQQFHCIFRTLGTLFELASTKLTQNNAVDVFNRQKKYDLLILTARTAKFRAATKRELKKHKIDLSKEHLDESETEFDFSFNDGHRTARVTYKDGFVMASGLNKGLVLENILKKTNRQYKNIYFIDDSLKNIKNMKNAWDKKSTKMNLFHYTHVDKKINKTEIAESEKAKDYFDQFLKSAYPDQLARFKNNQCD